MDLSFIRRSIEITLTLTALAFLALLAYGRSDWAWGVGLGSVWACVNWILITIVVRVVLTRERALTVRAKIWLAVLILVKFPLLYGAGYVLLRQGFPVLSLLAGFWIILAVIVAKAAGRLVLGLDPVPLVERVKSSEGRSS
jgi:hypothetical protein